MNLTETWKIFWSSSWKYVDLGIKTFLSFEKKLCKYVVWAKSFKGIAFAVPKLPAKFPLESVLFLNFIILDEINKIFIKFLRLLNKSLFGMPSDDCVWGFTESVIQLSYFLTEKKLIRGKILSKVKTDCSVLALSYFFLLLYRLHFYPCNLP